MSSTVSAQRERSSEAEDHRALPLQAPPVGEEIHLPGPTIIPFMCAIGITLIVIGTTIWWVWSAIGGIITVLCVALWIRDTRHDVAELPEDHGH